MQQQQERRKILVTDDDPRIVKSIRSILTREGYEVITAADGFECLHATWALEPDLILLDIMMPRKDGWHVLNELKNDPRTLHIPVIVLTAVDSLVDINKGVQMGSDFYLTKPFQAEELLAIVHHVMEDKPPDPE